MKRMKEEQLSKYALIIEQAVSKIVVSIRNKATVLVAGAYCHRCTGERRREGRRGCSGEEPPSPIEHIYTFQRFCQAKPSLHDERTYHDCCQFLMLKIRDSIGRRVKMMGIPPSPCWVGAHKYAKRDVLTPIPKKSLLVVGFFLLWKKRIAQKMH